MNKMKTGFTLAEVLVTLAIIGVVTALVIPQLVKNSQKNSAGALLGKAVEQIELGCQNMIQNYNINTYGPSQTETLAGMDNFTFGQLSHFVGATSVRISNRGGNRFMPYSQYKFNKFPVEFRVPRRLVINVPDAGSEEDYKMAVFVSNIVIDVNGFSKVPNEPGRDRFTFDLRNDGKLIPHGLGTDTCFGDNPTIDEDCTARVVADGFKINY